MKKILIFVEELYEDLELWYPKIRLEEAGFSTVVAGPEADKVYKGKHGYPCKAQIEFKEAAARDFEGLLIPGGYAPDKLRRYAKVLELTHQFNEQNKCIAFICHAGWVPISAKIVKGRKLTSFTAIKDDLENAGANWVDKDVVIDKNFVTSRTPADLPVFAKAMIEVLK